MIKILYDAKQNEFVAVEGAEVFRMDLVRGEKWECRTRWDGSVKCTTSGMVDGKYLETTLRISSNGFFRVSRIKEGTKNNVKCFKIKDWPVVGVITLTNGPIEERNAYFEKIASCT